MKYISENDLKRWLNDHKKNAEKRQQETDCHIDDGCDAYYQGEIDIIELIAEHFALEPLWIPEEK